MESVNTSFLIQDKTKPEHDVQKVRKRVVWSRKAEYLLSLIGYTIGLSSVWRIPYLCMRNGGGAFLIPHLIFLVCCGFPLYFMELALGQFSGKSPLIMWCICPLLKGIGYCSFLISLIYAWYGSLVIAWILIYLYYSFYPIQPWSTCNNPWNSPNCVSSRTRDLTVNNDTQTWNNTYMNSTMTNVLNGTNRNLSYYPSAANEFWKYQILNESEGLENFGSIQWHIVLALFVTYAICFLSIIKGVKSVGKVVYVTAVLPYLLIIIIFIKSLTMKGSIDGVIYFFTPDFSKLLSLQVWIEASLQVFYSLGPAWGGLITMASYNEFKNNFLSDAVIVVVMESLTAILCGMVVCSILGYLSYESGLSITEVSEAGPGLVFQAYPEVLTRLPLPQLWAVLFFIMLLTVGLDSQFGMLETVISGLADKFPETLGKRKILVILATFAVYFITSLIFATQAGVYVFQLIDWYSSIFVVFLISFLECVAVGYIYGAERFSRDVQIMIGRPIPMFIRISICIITPISMVIALCATVLNYQHPTYKGYVYPQYTGVIGMMIALISVIPVPVLAIVQMISSRGTFKQRVSKQTSASTEWLPNDDVSRLTYRRFTYSGGFWQKLRRDVSAH